MSCSSCAALQGKVDTLEWRLNAVIDEKDLADQQLTHAWRQITYLKTKLKEQKAADDPSKDVQDIFDYWLVATQKDPARTKLTSKRKDAIRKALREGYSVADIQRATEGLAWDPFKKNGVVYNDIGVACRNVELYREKADAMQGRFAKEGEKTAEDAREFLIKETRPHASKPNLPALWAGGFELFAEALRRKGCRILDGSGHRFRAQCPAHDGSNPQALSVIEADDGRVLAKCFSGCTWEQICEALGHESSSFGPRGSYSVYGSPTDSGGQISFGGAA